MSNLDAAIAALGVVTAAMGAASIPTAGPIGFISILIGGLFVFGALRERPKETKDADQV